ncbi:hypothetical protein [Streptomyces xantholiticus]|uniref:Uncharacterized protein n=1 Tax=Streptomyces xantholiticus TaxID=68285 RepID=A0ABV1V5S6_9ACTN
MSDEKQPKPELTPEQLQKQEQAEQQQDASEIKQQYAGTDMMHWLNDILPFGLSVSTNYLGTSNFEGRKLNEMLDLLDSANPADLENAGETLQKATKALNKAAKELSDFVTGTDWKGEAALAFESYGQSLVTYAWDVGRYANAVGAQMKVASTGLASVRNSKPPRDGRLVQKKPEDFSMPERTEGNADYQKALQAEKDRQEAINLMNRLASYYTVSNAMLTGEKIPTPPKRLDVAVPEPTRVRGPGESYKTGAVPAETARATAQSSGAESDFLGGRDSTSGVADTRTAPVLSSNTSMQIDTVTAPPSPTTAPNTPPPSPVTGPPSSQNGPLPQMPFTSGPVRNPNNRLSGPPIARATGGPGADKLGRTGSTGHPNPPVGRATGTPGVPRVSGGPASDGRANNPVGRPTGMGPGGGQVGRGGQTTGQPPMTGRAGTTGQPITGRTASGPSTGMRGGRGDSIVGGTPQRTAGGSASGRIPKGTVVGGESLAQGRSAASRPGQSGVIGASSGNAGQHTTGRGPASSNGVVGTPRNSGQRARPGAGGYTTGGAAVLGGRRNQRQSGEDELERSASERPDYLTEDEETWAARRRGPVPPVID